MKSNRNISYFLRNLGVKHRLSLRDQHGDKEVWYMHLSPLAAMASMLALVLVMFIVIISIAAYTPLLDMVPGHPMSRSRETLITNIMRVDSLEMRLNDMQVYTKNIGLIIDGKNPVTLTSLKRSTDSLRESSGGNISRSAIDSALRAQLEGGGAYGLPDPSSLQKARLAGMQLTAPVKGVIVSSFSSPDGGFGTLIATAANQEIVAVADGTVIMSIWLPSDSYLIQIQHADNMISEYKHCRQALKTTGTRVKAGEVIGYTGEAASGSVGSNYFYFGLWSNGTPVDPQNYITF